jgi:hypothetical protein
MEITIFSDSYGSILTPTTTITFSESIDASLSSFVTRSNSSIHISSATIVTGALVVFSIIVLDAYLLN